MTSDNDNYRNLLRTIPHGVGAFCLSRLAGHVRAGPFSTLEKAPNHSIVCSTHQHSYVDQPSSEVVLFSTLSANPYLSPDLPSCSLASFTAARKRSACWELKRFLPAVRCSLHFGPRSHASIQANPRSTCLEFKVRASMSNPDCVMSFLAFALPEASAWRRTASISL